MLVKGLLLLAFADRGAYKNINNNDGKQLLDDRKAQGDANAMLFRDWDDWIASSQTQVIYS